MKNHAGPVFDLHQHVLWGGRDIRGLIADLDQHGIAEALLMTWQVGPYEQHTVEPEFFNSVQVQPDGTHNGLPLGDLLRAIELYPKRLHLGYCPHPLWPGAPQMLRSATEMYGVRLCGEWKFTLPLDDPRSLEVFKMAGELGQAVLLHLDVPYLAGNPRLQRVWFGGDIEALERTLKACPRTTFIGHAPGFWREFDADAPSRPEQYPEGPMTGEGRLQALMRRHEHLVADISAKSGLIALTRDPVYTRRFLIEFQDRVVFGRDKYGGDHQAFLDTLDLPSDVLGKLLWSNARRLLRLT
ncbi:MAG TPA: amidohydrolase family protein [Opitutaceae bacterium]|jgi:predicted TIM-barrel fold metal-dependent hydrolase|nr:amidohydrolase family protein [Opitutaceae bacterium]